MDERQARNTNTNLQWMKNGILEVCLDMEAHMPSATQNNSKKNKTKQPRKEEYP